MDPSFWVCAIVTVASAVTSLGFSVAAVRTAEGERRRTAWYATSRSGALVVVALLAAGVQSVSWLTAIALAMILVQLGDAVVGRVARDTWTTLGPAGTAPVNLATLIWMLG